MSENHFDGRVAKVHSLRMEAGQVLDGEAAFGGQDSGDEEVLDGNERRNQGHLEKASCERLGKDVPKMFKVCL